MGALVHAPAAVRRMTRPSCQGLTPREVALLGPYAELLDVNAQFNDSLTTMSPAQVLASTIYLVDPAKGFQTRPVTPSTGRNTGMVKGGLPGQTGAIFHFCLLRRISGEGKGLKNTDFSENPLVRIFSSIKNYSCLLYTSDAADEAALARDALGVDGAVHGGAADGAAAGSDSPPPPLTPREVSFLVRTPNCTTSVHHSTIPMC